MAIIQQEVKLNNDNDFQLISIIKAIDNRNVDEIKK